MTFDIAFIGCGWIANDSHGPACAEYAAQREDTRLSACCDVSPERAEKLHERFGFQRSYTDYVEMLETTRPSAVCLNVPPERTAEIGVEVMRRGFPLLCEKPPGLSTTELDRLVEAADAAGVIHLVAFNRRFMPLAGELKKRLAGQTVHHIAVQQAREHRYDPVFATTAIHVVDLARFLAGSDYEQVKLQYQEQPRLGPGVANYRLDGRFSGGVTVEIDIFPTAGINIERTVIYAQDQAYFLEANNGPDAPGRLRQVVNGQVVLDKDAASFTGRRENYYLNGFTHQDAAFFDAVRSGIQPAHDFRSCRQAVAIMQCMAERRGSYP